MELEQLRIFTRDVLDTSRPAFTLRDDVLGIAQVLGSLASFHIDRSTDIGTGETLGEDGWALSPAMAALCAEDFVRTAIFMRGLYQAIQVALSHNSRRPIRVLYAGSGPYALLAVPLLAVLSPQDVRFTLLDIHEESIESARAIVDRLGLPNYVTDYVVDDACRYQIPSDRIPQVVVSETMNAALEKEPQVTIARRLFHQAPKAILVPKSIRVDAALVNMSKEFVLLDPDHQGELPEPERDRVSLGTVFELSTENILSWSEESGETLPGGRIEFPESVGGDYQPMLLTTIQVYGKHMLSDYDSGLTNPRTFPPEAVIEPGLALQFQYRLGQHPRLTCTVC